MSRRYVERVRFAQLPSISADLLEHHSTSYGPHLEYLLRLNLPQCARSSAQSPPISLDLLGAGVNEHGGSGLGRCCQEKASIISANLNPQKYGREGERGPEGFHPKSGGL